MDFCHYCFMMPRSVVKGRRGKKRLRAFRCERADGGGGKIKAAVVGGKHLKSSPHCLLYTPGFSRLDYPSRKTTAEINNTAEGRSRSEDQGSHTKPAKPFADYGRNTLKLHRYAVPHILPRPLRNYIRTNAGRWLLKYSTWRRRRFPNE